MNRKCIGNNGSALIMILIIFAVLSVLGTTLYSVAVTNEKIGIMNNQMKRNFYFAEAGIEEAYGKLTNVIDEAIQEGNVEARRFIENIDLEVERKKEKSNFILDNGDINDEYIINEQNRIFIEAYNNHLDETLEDTLENEEDYLAKDNGTYLIEVEYDRDEKTVIIESSFTKENNQRKVKAKYQLSDPEYSQMYYYQSKKVKVPKDPLLTKVISAEKNVTIKSSTMDINGDMHIGNDLLVKSNKTKNINIIGNVLSKNFTIDDDSKNNTIFIDTLYTKDDFNVKGKDSVITLDNYYGYSYGDGAQEPSKSSAIVIDSLEENDNIALTIKDNLSILGTAFIETLGEKYQTGESISIKKNYKAYSKELNDDTFSKENLEFRYYNPLVLISKYNSSPLTINDKAEYFYQVTNSYDNLGMKLGKGITIPSSSKSIKSLGVLLNDGQVVRPYNTNLASETDKLVSDVEELIGELDQGVTTHLVMNADFTNNNMIDQEEEVIVTTTEDIEISSDEPVEGIYITTGNIDIKGNLDFKGIIIAGENISVSGDVTITGTIISGMNISFSENSIISINKDEDYLYKLLARNELITDRLFNKEYNDEDILETLAKEEIKQEDDIIYQDMKDLVNLLEWNLVK